MSAIEHVDKLLGTAALANTLLYLVLNRSLKATAGRSAPRPLHLGELGAVVSALILGTVICYLLAVVFGAPLYA